MQTAQMQRSPTRSPNQDVMLNSSQQFSQQSIQQPASQPQTLKRTSIHALLNTTDTSPTTKYLNNMPLSPTTELFFNALLHGEAANRKTIEKAEKTSPAINNIQSTNKKAENTSSIMPPPSKKRRGSNPTSPRPSKIVTTFKAPNDVLLNSGTFFSAFDEKEQRDVTIQPTNVNGNSPRRESMVWSPSQFLNLQTPI